MLLVYKEGVFLELMGDYLKLIAVLNTGNKCNQVYILGRNAQFFAQAETGHFDGAGTLTRD